MTTGKITVIIPADSQNTTFRLDPHRCPDNTAKTATDTSRVFARVRGDNKGTSEVSIGIIGTDDESLSFDNTSTKLSIEYNHDINVAATTLPLFSTDYKNELETVFTSFRTSNGVKSGSPLLYVDAFDTSNSDYNDALKKADKITGKYGSKN